VIAAGCLAACLARPPDLLVSPDGRLMAVNPPGGHLLLSRLTGQRFVADAWLSRFAEDQPADLAAAGGEAADGSGSGAGAGVQCDRFGCLYRAGAQLVALATDARALAEDCRVATVLISAVPVRGRCPSANLVIDRFDLWRAGAHALWLSDAGVTVESVRGYRGVRPWAPAPEARRRAQSP
jgi:competence protein ComEC